MQDKKQWRNIYIFLAFISFVCCLNTCSSCKNNTAIKNVDANAKSGRDSIYNTMVEIQNDINDDMIDIKIDNRETMFVFLIYEGDLDAKRITLSEIKSQIDIYKKDVMVDEEKTK